MIVLRRRAILIAGAALAVAGCGSSHNGGGNVAIDDVPAQYAGAACPTLQMCLGPFVATFLGGNCQTALEDQLADQDLPRWKMAIAMGTIVYHGDQVGPCAAAIQAAGCSVLASSNLPPACQGVFEGTIAVAGPCNMDEECMGDSYCDFSGSGTCPGTCKAKAAMGGSCTDDIECQNGLVCNGGSCGMPVGSGDACGGSTDANCPTGTFCIGANAMTPGTCRTLTSLMTAASGATCKPPTDSGDVVLCQSGLSCGVDMVGAMGATFKCTGLSTAGGACQYGFPDPCPTGQYCNADISMGMVSGTCTALPTAGQPCDSSSVAPSCADGLACISGTCVRVGRIGDACTTDDGCYSKNCDSGSCAAGPYCTNASGSGMSMLPPMSTPPAGG